MFAVLQPSKKTKDALRDVRDVRYGCKRYPPSREQFLGSLPQLCRRFNINLCWQATVAGLPIPQS